MLRNFVSPIISYPQSVPMQHLLLSQVHKMFMCHYHPTNLFSLLPGNRARPNIPGSLGVALGIPSRPGLHNLSSSCPVCWMLMNKVTIVASYWGLVFPCFILWIPTETPALAGKGQEAAETSVRTSVIVASRGALESLMG